MHWLVGWAGWTVEHTERNKKKPDDVGAECRLWSHHRIMIRIYSQSPIIHFVRRNSVAFVSSSFFFHVDQSARMSVAFGSSLLFSASISRTATLSPSAPRCSSSSSFFFFFLLFSFSITLGLRPRTSLLATAPPTRSLRAFGAPFVWHTSHSSAACAASSFLVMCRLCLRMLCI